MKTVQNQKNLGQSVGFALVFVGMTVAVVVLMITQSGGWQ